MFHHIFTIKPISSDLSPEKPRSIGHVGYLIGSFDLMCSFTIPDLLTPAKMWIKASTGPKSGEIGLTLYEGMFQK